MQNFREVILFQFVINIPVDKRVKYTSKDVCFISSHYFEGELLEIVGKNSSLVLGGKKLFLFPFQLVNFVNLINQCY